MPVSAVRTRLGSDVSLWCQMLTEAKAARAVVESSSREKAFGPVIVDYSSVQAKVGGDRGGDTSDTGAVFLSAGATISYHTAPVVCCVPCISRWSGADVVLGGAVTQQCR